MPDEIMMRNGDQPILWFSYSTLHGLDAPEPPNSPYSLTWNVGRYLREHVMALGYGFQYVNLDDTSDHDIQPQDIILAHSWYPAGFMTATLDKKVKARFLIQPYQHDIVGKNESWWIKDIVEECDHLFFVTGKYWYDTMSEGLYGDWKDKVTRLDMAVNPLLHPHSKRRWNKPGQRKFLAIGADIPYKGLGLIADLARVAGFHLGYYGSAPHERFVHVPQFVHHGARDFTPEVQAQISNEYDAFISLAIGDANPTTLLETACWGMLPMCNLQSGYYPDDPFMELSTNYILFNLSQIDYIQQAPEYELRQRADAIRQRVLAEHTWDKFCKTLWDKLGEWL